MAFRNLVHPLLSRILSSMDWWRHQNMAYTNLWRSNTSISRCMLKSSLWNHCNLQMQFNIIWIIIIEIILTAYAQCPLPWELLRRVGILLSVYRIYLCGHSSRHQVMDQKSSFFICPRVSARFLHCFCTVSRDAMGTLTCKIRQRVQKLPSRKSRCFAQKWHKLETSKIRVFCPVGSFNQMARDSSFLEHTEITRRIVRFLVDFPFSGALHTFCTPAGKPCFSLHCLHSVHCEPNLSGQSPSILLAQDRSVA